jgi:hypothetical protein
VNASPAEDEEEELDIELDDPTIDESLLPPLDEQDAEVLPHHSGYDDLIDRNWLERGVGEEGDDDAVETDAVGFTIELNETSTDDDGAQVVDLDVGSLLTSLPSEGTELDLDPRNEPQRGVADGSLALGALRDMLLPDSDDEENDDTEVGDDDRFPAFDDASDIAPRPGRDDTSDRDDLIDHEDLT